MSDTLAELDQAIQRHIGTVGEGAVAEAWILVVHSQQVDDNDALSGYRIVTSETQPHHVDRGLIEVGRTIVQDSWDEYLTEVDDED